MIRLLLADDEELVRTGLRMILSAEAAIEVVAEASDGAQAVDLAARHRPDIALLDVRMPRLTGIDVVPHLPSVTRAVMLTTFDLDEYVYAALRVGAAGFLLKTDPATTMIDALRVVADGGALLAPTVTRRRDAVLRRKTRRRPSTRAELTPSTRPRGAQASSQRTPDRHRHTLEPPRFGSPFIFGVDPVSAPTRARASRSGPVCGGRLLIRARRGDSA